MEETTQATEDESLCRSCARGGRCTFPRAPGMPAVNCELFEGQECAEGFRSRDTTGSTTSGVEGGGTWSLPGLCRSCLNERGCAFPRSFRGVWNCEGFAW